MAGDPTWCLADTSTQDKVDALAAEIARGPLAPRMSLLEDPRWLSALVDEATKSVRAYVWRCSDAIVGFAGFLVHPSAIRVAFGELTLLSIPVRHLRSFAAPVVATSSNADDEQRALASLFRQMRQDLAADEVIFLESALADSTIMTFLKAWEAERHEFHVLQNGNLYQHRYAMLGDDFEAYLKQLGSRTRADLRSTRKKFIAHVNGGYSTRCFRTAEEVSEFVDVAISVSSKTYQYDLLGAGLRDHDALKKRYRATADLGWFRSYILYAGDKPIAFQAGHLYGGRYHAQEIGYDPEWARHHVGIFLHTEIIADLSAPGGGVQCFDFGIGDTQHKQRLSTGTSAGGYYYLIPDTMRGSLVANTVRATNAVSAALGRVLDRFGWRQKVRQTLRRLGAAR